MSPFVTRHTVVLSDVHLSELEPRDGPWMRYRQRACVVDGELAAMLAALEREVAGEALTLVLNGDVFDLDAPRVVGDRSVFHDLPRTAEHAVPALAAILDDHPAVVSALGRVVAQGHTLVVVSGNHDVELTLPEARALLRSRIVAAAASSGDLRAGDTVRGLAARVLFRAWLHRTPDGIVIEHGHQYDLHCSYRYPMAPFGHAPGEIQPTFGSLAARHLVSRLGYLNPHDDASIVKSTWGYVAHWARYYLWSPRSLLLTWLRGSARTLRELTRRRHPGRRALRRENLQAASAETGVPLRTLGRHARLFEPPAEDRLDAALRALGLDRALALLLATLAGVALAVVARGPWALAGLLSPLMVPLWTRLFPRAPLADVWGHIGRVARKVRAIHDARAVVFGHTHRPEESWVEGCFLGNSGSWSAGLTEPARAPRPVIWLTSGGPAGDALRGGLTFFHDGRFQAGPQSTGTARERSTPGSEAANASAKNSVKPTCSAR